MAKLEKLRPNPNGSIDIVKTDSNRPGATIRLSQLRTPWAKDGNGHSVPTHYTVAGSVLTQHVDTNANTAFPVVADPELVWFWGDSGSNLTTMRPERSGILKP